MRVCIDSFFIKCKLPGGKTRSLSFLWFPKRINVPVQLVLEERTRKRHYRQNDWSYCSINNRSFQSHQVLSAEPFQNSFHPMGIFTETKCVVYLCVLHLVYHYRSPRSYAPEKIHCSSQNAIVDHSCSFYWGAVSAKPMFLQRPGDLSVYTSL